MRRILIVSTLCIFGCSTTTQVDPSPDTSSEVTETVKTGRQASDTISESVDELRAIASSGRKDSPELPQWTSVDQKSSDIEQANAIIARQFEILDKLTAQLKDTERAARESASEIERLNSKIEALKDKSNQWIFRVSLSLAALGIATGVGLMFVPGMRRMGATVLAASTACAGVAKFFIQFPWVLPLIGGCLLLGILYVLWRNRKTVLDVVDFGESVKREKTWDDETRKRVDSVEDKSTKKAVKDAKRALERRRGSK